MNRKLRLSAMAVMGLVVGGCWMQSNSPLVRYDKGGDVRLTTAPEDADYSLYAAGDATPMVGYTLSKGERIGFTRNDDGSITAVAGSNTQTVNPAMTAQAVYWREEKGN
jgi:hypothetical protein